jgi:tetratricopeptide (TPR) repeat protein
MKKILLIALTLSCVVLNISCSQNDGFKDEAERSFMKAHGIKTREDLDRLLKANDDERINIAAHSFASQVDLKYVEECSAYVAVVFNAASKENIGNVVENEKLKNAYLFMWDKVFNDMVKEGEKKEQSMRAIKAKFIYNANVFEGNDEVAKKKILDTNAECTKKIVPYFSFEEIESYVEKQKTSSITQTNPTQQSAQTPAQPIQQSTPIATPAPTVKVDTTSVTECDELAGSPMDPQKKSAGVPYDKIEAIKAANACQKAVKIEQSNSRLWFELGRALEKGDSINDSIAAYQKGAELGSAAAYNNIGELYRQGKGFPKDKQKAVEYFKKAADLGSEEGKANLAPTKTAK